MKEEYATLVKGNIDLCETLYHVEFAAGLIALLMVDERRFDESARHRRQTLEVHTACFGNDCPEVAQFGLLLARIHASLSNHDMALYEATKAIEYYKNIGHSAIIYFK